MTTAPIGMARAPSWFTLCVIAMTLAVVVGTARPTEAFPYFARKYDVTCHTCHSTVPKLNATGVGFRERGYRLARDTRPTIPFAGGFALRYENRLSDGVDDAYLKIVKAVTGGPIGTRGSFVVKWHPLDRTLDRRGRLIDRSGVFEDLFLNIDLDQNLRLTVGQFRVFNQFDASRQLSASPPLALAMGVPGDEADTDRQTDLRGFAPAQRMPAVMLTHYRPSADSGPAADGLYFHASIPFSGEFAIPSTDRARREAPFALEPKPKGLFLEGYDRQGLRTIGGGAFLDTDRQLYTGMFSIDPGRLATAFVYSQAVVRGEGARRVSWWGEYRPSYRSNIGLRVDDPGSWIEATMYGDYQWFSERAMVWLLVEQRIRASGHRTLAQIKLVF